MTYPLKEAVGSFNFDPGLASKVPTHLHDDLARYIIDGIPDGSSTFLMAVLVNDLRLAVQKADRRMSMEDMRALTQFLHWCAPAECYGSPERVRAWIEKKEAA